MLRHWRTKVLWYIRMLACLFGGGSSVFNFGRWSAYLEAIPRRLLDLLWPMYVDDGQITDLQAAKGEGQVAVEEFFELSGAGMSL